MKSNRAGKTWLALLFSIVLVGGAASLLSSPNANASAGINWAHVWKTQLKPLADKRYYTKKKARAKFAAKSSLAGYTPSGTAYTKAESDAKYAPNAALANYYTKAQSDANYYSKAQSDAKYAPFPAVIRGTYGISATATAASQLSLDNIGFGVTLSAAPTIHYINVGAAVPAGCLGTAAAPDAAPGNLCVFESYNSNTGSRGVYNPATSTGLFGQSSAFGTGVYAYSGAAGSMITFGTWAVRPLALSSSRVGSSTQHSTGGIVH